MILSLGLGMGLGLTSLLYFALSFITQSAAILWAAEFLLGTFMAGLAWSRRKPIAPVREFRSPAHGVEEWILGTLFVQALLLAGIVAARSYALEPWGSSDGWTIWNMHARIMHRGGGDWADVLRAPQLGWTHPDYPLLVPASVARVWTLAGRETAAAAGLVSTLFGIATLGLLVSAVTRLRSPAIAYVGGLLLLGTPFFVTFTPNQHADIPLGFHLLATLVLVAASRETSDTKHFAILAGISTGLAAWTKNEGLLFVVVMGASSITWALIASRLRTAAAFLATLAIALLPILAFKLAIAPANDIVSSTPWTRLHSILDGSRHALILQSLWRDLARFGEWSVLPFLAMLLPWLGRGWKRLTPREWMVAVVLALVLAGYYGVYLLTHMDLAFHLDSSLVRLLLQLWPGALFFWCLGATAHDHDEVAVTSPGAATRNRRALFVLGNVILGAALLVLMGRQLPANQFASTRIAHSTLGVYLGEGWFGPEWLGNERWAWSPGESVLQVRVEGGAVQDATLHFGIRALGRRDVSVNLGDRVIWRGQVGETADLVEIKGLSLAPGIHPLVFRSAEPGVAESAAPDARKLTFAVYNPRLK